MTRDGGGRSGPPLPRRSRFAVVALAAGLAACGGVREQVVPDPYPVAAPVAALEPVLEEAAPFEPDLVAPTLVEVRDALRTTPMLRHADFTAEVDRWVDRWSGATAPWFARDLERMGDHVAAIDSMLAARGLPGALRYLPIIESGYNPVAVSPARAVGLWQLMEGTARGLGVHVSPLLDERRDPRRSTEAALDFLEELHQDFGSWFLALAAYNSGPGRVRRVLNQHAPLEPPSDSLFWVIRPRLPRETRDFVPKLFAAIRIAERPDVYGHPRPAIVPLVYDEIQVPDATTLDVVARAAGISQEEVERLNPHVVRGITPPETIVTLRLPEGTGARFAERYAEIPPEERVTFLEHRVAQGETLSHIAVRYGIRVADLEAANPGLRPRYLRVGALLTIPVAPSARGRG